MEQDTTISSASTPVLTIRQNTPTLQQEEVLHESPFQPNLSPQYTWTLPQPVDPGKMDYSPPTMPLRLFGQQVITHDKAVAGGYACEAHTLCGDHKKCLRCSSSRLMVDQSHFYSNLDNYVAQFEALVAANVWLKDYSHQVNKREYIEKLMILLATEAAAFKREISKGGAVRLPSTVMIQFASESMLGKCFVMDLTNEVSRYSVYTAYVDMGNSHYKATMLALVTDPFLCNLSLVVAGDIVEAILAFQELARSFSKAQLKMYSGLLQLSLDLEMVLLHLAFGLHTTLQPLIESFGIPRKPHWYECQSQIMYTDSDWVNDPNWVPPMLKDVRPRPLSREELLARHHIEQKGEQTPAASSDISLRDEQALIIAALDQHFEKAQLVPPQQPQQPSYAPMGLAMGKGIVRTLNTVMQEHLQPGGSSEAAKKQRTQEQAETETQEEPVVLVAEEEPVPPIELPPPLPECFHTDTGLPLDPMENPLDKPQFVYLFAHILYLRDQCLALHKHATTTTELLAQNEDTKNQQLEYQKKVDRALKELEILKTLSQAIRASQETTEDQINKCRQDVNQLQHELHSVLQTGKTMEQRFPQPQPKTMPQMQRRWHQESPLTTTAPETTSTEAERADKGTHTINPPWRDAEVEPASTVYATIAKEALTGFTISLQQQRELISLAQTKNYPCWNISILEESVSFNTKLPRDHANAVKIIADILRKSRPHLVGHMLHYWLPYHLLTETLHQEAQREFSPGELMFMLQTAHASAKHKFNSAFYVAELSRHGNYWIFVRASKHLWHPRCTSTGGPLETEEQQAPREYASHAGQSSGSGASWWQQQSWRKW